MSATMDYKYGQKNHWRRSAWNAIKKRIKARPDEAVVLYLGGRQDIDRVTAISKGFKSQNLFFIDNDREIVAEQRSYGNPAICGDILAVAKAWPASIRVDALICDFCSGLEESIVDRLVALTMFPQLRNAVFAVNLLRGRDPSSNWVRTFVQNELLTGHKDLHRGRLLLTMVQFWFARVASHSTSIHVHGTDISAVHFEERAPYLTEDHEEVKLLKSMKTKVMAMLPGALRYGDEWLHTYTSTSRQVFDSVVFKNYFGFEPTKFDPDLDAALIKTGSDPMRRQIAAVLAHRTRRIDSAKKRKTA